MMKHFIAALLTSVVLFTAARADAACTTVSGTGQATDSPCTESPLGLCVDGTIAGSFVGTYHASYQSLVPDPTLAQPLRFAFTLNSTIGTSSGNLYQHETGYVVMNDVIGALACVTGCGTNGTCLASCLDTYGRSSFTQNMTPYAGTGVYSSITGGSIVASGYGEYTSDVSYVTYSGNICD